MRLIFTKDHESIQRLDEIMNSYPGRDQGSILADPESAGVVLRLLLQRQIICTEHSYLIDANIHEDPSAMEIYTALARQTRWRLFEFTEIGEIRSNALRQLRSLGKPAYDGFICYRDGQVCAHCGNLRLTQFLMYLADHEQLERFYLFTYPYWTLNHTAKYVVFEISGGAIAGAKVFQRDAWKKIRKASETWQLFPISEDTGEGPTDN